MRFDRVLRAKQLMDEGLDKRPEAVATVVEEILREWEQLKAGPIGNAHARETQLRWVRAAETGN